MCAPYAAFLAFLLRQTVMATSGQMVAQDAHPVHLAMSAAGTSASG